MSKLVPNRAILCRDASMGYRYVILQRYLRLYNHAWFEEKSKQFVDVFPPRQYGRVSCSARWFECPQSITSAIKVCVFGRPSGEPDGLRARIFNTGTKWRMLPPRPCQIKNSYIPTGTSIQFSYFEVCMKRYFARLQTL